MGQTPDVVIPLHRPVCWGHEVEYVTEAIRSGNVASGPFVERFEQALAVRLGCPHVVAVSSGTAALHLALLALGAGPGVEVLVPDLTFAATANAVVHCGARPVFIDVEPDYWQMDAARVEEYLARNQRGFKILLSVDLLGHPSQQRRLRDLIWKYGGFDLEDRTESLGTEDEDAPGIRLACFSFNGNKVITAGGGGAVATDDDNVDWKVRMLRDQGKAFSDPADHMMVGYNYRMPNMMAALGLAQLEYLDTILGRKGEIASCYCRGLEGLGAVELPKVAPGVKPNWWLYTVLVPGESIERLVKAFAEAGIEVRRMFRPLSSLQAFRGRHLSIPVPSQSLQIYNRALCLPSGPGLRYEDQERVLEVLWRELKGG